MFRRIGPYFTVLLALVQTNAWTQMFSHIEAYAGLEASKENNAVAIADYNGDGLPDIFLVGAGVDDLSSPKTRSRLYKNTPEGIFQDVTEEAGLLQIFFPKGGDVEPAADALKGVKYGAFWGDYDNDGFPDLFLTTLYRVFLFHNDGEGSFKEVTQEAGFPEMSTCIYTDATWFDYNNDGFLDLYVSDWAGCGGNSFYVNQGNGTFVNKSELFPDTGNKYSFMSLPFDFNRDGWQDLYLANDVHGQSNDLFINQKGKGFTEEAENYKLHFDQNSMGLALGDYNNDTQFDIFITNIDKNVLFESTGIGKPFIETSTEQGVKYSQWAWDAVFADFDLDGDEDLFVANGFNYSRTNEQQNVYFENLHANDQPRFINKSESSGLGDLTISVSAGIFDFDNDGDLDILVTNSDRPSYLYENSKTHFTDENPKVHWLKIGLEGTNSNRDAIGTLLQIKTDKETLVRYFTGKGFLYQNKLPVHFGLADASEILELKITWPSGLVEVFTNLPLDKTLNFREGAFYQISTIQPSKKIYGCADPNSCNYNPYALVSTGVCRNLKANSFIYGNGTAHNSGVESYSYPPENGNTAVWSISGGSIIEGQNTTSVKVKWGSGSSGTLSVIEKNANCSSNPVSITVRLKPDGLLEEGKFSTARLWNETLLSLIRTDYARPTVHARNLFHTSVVMYDAWSVYDEEATPYLLGKELNGFNSKFCGFETSEDLVIARDKTISYAAYGLLLERFKRSPDPVKSREILYKSMLQLGYDPSYVNDDYTNGDPRALGNYIAKQVIEYGLMDGSNEKNDYANTYYSPVNPPLSLIFPADIEAIDPNRWQPISFQNFIDQSGNIIGGVTPDFLSPEWGSVRPFALSGNDKLSKLRDGQWYDLYFDPGIPPQNPSADYEWNFSLVSKWSSHLDPYDGVVWDISPRNMGNISEEELPKVYSNFKNFYNEFEGGDLGKGRLLNPVTQTPYEPQYVPRGDYTRVLAEFWADGPDSETPPGHWFTILNHVSDSPLLEKKFEGKGVVLDALEWDVKCYFILGGAMHDAAIAAWGIKGYYDYIRPISAIRFMCAMGQRTNPNALNYNKAGIELREGYIEQVSEEDTLAGPNKENVGKIKLFAWKGHDYIDDVTHDEAGVGWILAENWWPYQRPSFVTPPFAGYVSGHSTYSRAAAEVLTSLTGTPYFPGGIGEFIAKKDRFLKFEKGPSVDVYLQWATYRDASDQCSLSRIWGGIHPPADDIAGRHIGIKVGQEAFEIGKHYFEGLNKKANLLSQKPIIYPNPVSKYQPVISVLNTRNSDVFQLIDLSGRIVNIPNKKYNDKTGITTLTLNTSLSTGIYILKINSISRKIIFK